MPFVSFVVNQNRLTKSHVEIDAETVIEKLRRFGDALSALDFIAQPTPHTCSSSPLPPDLAGKSKQKSIGTLNHVD